MRNQTVGGSSPLAGTINNLRIHFGLTRRPEGAIEAHSPSTKVVVVFILPPLGRSSNLAGGVGDAESDKPR